MLGISDRYLITLYLASMMFLAAVKIYIDFMSYMANLHVSYYALYILETYYPADQNPNYHERRYPKDPNIFRFILEFRDQIYNIRT